MKIVIMGLSLIVSIFALVGQVHLTSLAESLVVPYADALQENIASNQLEQQINSSVSSVIASMATYDGYIRNFTDQILGEYDNNIQQKVSSFKSTVNSVQSRSYGAASGKNIVFKCLMKDGQLEVLGNQINSQVKKCATIALAEMSNVISDSLKEAQTFMSIPRVIGKDIQRCGLSYTCRWDIVGDAISEAVQVPPKVFALAAKIQSIALRTVISIDSCGLQGLKEITQTAVGILEDIFLCISNTIDGVTSTNTTKQS